MNYCQPFELAVYRKWNTLEEIQSNYRICEVLYCFGRGCALTVVSFLNVQPARTSLLAGEYCCVIIKFTALWNCFFVDFEPAMAEVSVLG